MRRQISPRVFLHVRGRSFSCVLVTCAFGVAIAVPAIAANRATCYTVEGTSVRVVTDLVLNGNAQPFRESVVPGSDPAAIRVTDRRTGERIPATVRAGMLEFSLTPRPGEKAEPRVRIEEAASAALYWKPRRRLIRISSRTVAGSE